MPESVLQSAPEESPARTADVYRAAAELMLEKGYGGTSIGDIAQTVGMTKAGLYYHISSKQGLLYQILTHCLDLLNRVVLTPVRLIEDPEERLRQVIRLNIQGQVEHGLTFTLLFRERVHLPPEQSKEIQGRIKEFHGMIRETLQELADSGRLRSLDLDIATMLTMSAITSISRWKKLNYQDFTIDVEHLIQETVAYSIAALLKPEP
ncbi:TetR/AcrR family transcriptional regulator [Planctomycetaceae bacterium]|nr:TetR/AcrR family transcriptional regulator [Planctomycetaceae bacterium]MDC0307716.1 TetR/AcrR family transcriptional regulator [Planctomycetaceae bacterium]